MSGQKPTDVPDSRPSDIAYDMSDTSFSSIASDDDQLDVNDRPASDLQHNSDVEHDSSNGKHSSKDEIKDDNASGVQVDSCFPFMRLPIEIRHMVYAAYRDLRYRACGVFGDKSIKFPPQLAGVNRQIRHEFSPIYFRDVSFVHNDYVSNKISTRSSVPIMASVHVDTPAGMSMSGRLPPDEGIMSYYKDFSILDIPVKAEHIVGLFPWERVLVHFVESSGRLEITIKWNCDHEIPAICPAHAYCQEEEASLRSVIEV